MKLQPGDWYTCFHCHGRFQTGWTDEEMWAEADAAFPAPIEEPVLLCDDCYTEVMDWWARQRP